MPLLLLLLLFCTESSGGGGGGEGLSDIRLTSGFDSNSGRVEVQYDGRWGTVCDSKWDNADAKVACQQLGLPSEAALAVTEASFGEGSGDIALDEVECFGSEQNLDECGHDSWWSHDCDHEDDAGVFCKNGNELRFLNILKLHPLHGKFREK